jgi:hypothetical protein
VRTLRGNAPLPGVRRDNGKKDHVVSARQKGRLEDREVPGTPQGLRVSDRKRTKERVVMKRLFFAVGVVALVSAPAFAQTKVVQEADKTVFRKKTVIDFTDVTVEGELTKPEGSYVLNRKKTRFNSLIKLRADFVPELQKSVDNL